MQNLVKFVLSIWSMSYSMFEHSSGLVNGISITETDDHHSFLRICGQLKPKLVLAVKLKFMDDCESMTCPLLMTMSWPQAADHAPRLILIA